MFEYACKNTHVNLAPWMQLSRSKAAKASIQAIGIGLVLTIAISAAVAQTTATVPSSHHVIVIMDENSSFTDVFNNMTWLVNEGKANGYATNYHSDNGGSLLDYLWIASGSCENSALCAEPPGNNFGCTGDSCTSPITDNNIFRLMNNAGISWKVYAQSYATAGGTPTTPDNANGTFYYRRHNGATWYSDILSNVDGSAGKIVDLSQLTTDLNNGALPEYMIIAPDGNHDAHDCPVGMSACTLQQKLQAADAFLQNTLTPILSQPFFQAGGDGVIFVTFDECASGTDAGCNASVFTAVIGPLVIPHTVSNIVYKHENLLRTTLDLMGFTANYPNNAATAADMSDFFNVSTGPNKPVVTVSTPADGSSGGSQVNVQASATPTTGATISGWHIYVDSTDVFSAGTVSSINTTLTLATGTHTVLVRAWDTTGAFGDRTLTVTANSSTPTVKVSTPLNNATVGSPVNLQASASPSAGNTITGWHIYDGNTDVFSAGAVTSINASLTLSAGSHNLTVRAWDTSKKFGDQLLTITVSSQPVVVVSTPSNNSNVINPTNIQASATSPSGTTITGWRIYVDNADVFSANAVNSINTNLNMSAGDHEVVVRAWDNTGAFGDQTLVLHVAPQNVAVNISTPMNGASVNSPVNIQASAQSANPITGWHIYVDSNDVFGGQMNASLINTNVSMGSGSHTVIVRAWDSTGAFGDQTITVTVP